MRNSLPTAPSVAALTVRRHRVADAVANLGETEVREALLAKATFFVKLGDKARAERVLRRPCADHTVLCLHTGCCGGGVRRDGEQGTGASERLQTQGCADCAPPLQTVALGQKMDLVFSIMRVHFMFGDFPAIKRDIRKARCVPFCFVRRA